jgi:hypothetical protein
VEKITEPWRARRMARVLISDVCAYAGDDVRMGLEKDDLLERLAPDIERARLWYRHQVALDEAEKIFDFAVVDVLVYANRQVSTHIW